jgi:hypothetical protein
LIVVVADVVVVATDDDAIGVGVDAGDIDVVVEQWIRSCKAGAMCTE